VTLTFANRLGLLGFRFFQVLTFHFLPLFYVGEAEADGATLDATLGSAIAHLLSNVRFCQVRAAHICQLNPLCNLSVGHQPLLKRCCQPSGGRLLGSARAGWSISSFFKSARLHYKWYRKPILRCTCLRAENLEIPRRVYNCRQVPYPAFVNSSPQLFSR
jgi:hypothetical protein